MKIFWVFAALSFGSLGFAQCVISQSNGSVAPNLLDPLFTSLTAENECPTNVFQLKTVLSRDGLALKPSLVANRGRNNPALGSFSFFETASGFSKTLNGDVKNGTFYFGHFTTVNGLGEVDLDQDPAPGKLLIELMAWDQSAGHFNFYELIGTATGGRWFYRGNSKDAFSDNQKLHLQSNPSRPQFGKTMRCSGCHTSGGPIMKELKAPHNDWWSKSRELPFAPNGTSAALKKYLNELQEASDFAAAVKVGQEELEASVPFQAFKKTLSLQERLRPLFCTTEINLVSSDKPLDPDVLVFHVPASYWVGAFFANASMSVEMEKARYLAAAKPFSFKFPETQASDADHAWLAPEKGHSDFLQIATLIKKEVVTEEFVSDVLAVDFKNPLFSKTRCDLLRLVPKTETSNWKAVFESELSQSSLAGAAELLANLTDSSQTKDSHFDRAQSYLKDVTQAASQTEALTAQLKTLIQNREAVFANEISKNPKGQILEPGFRVIFPVPSH